MERKEKLVKLAELIDFGLSLLESREKRKCMKVLDYVLWLLNEALNVSDTQMKDKIIRQAIDHIKKHYSIEGEG